MANCKMCGRRSMRILGVVNGVSVGRCLTCDARKCSDCNAYTADPHARQCAGCRRVF